MRPRIPIILALLLYAVLFSMCNKDNGDEMCESPEVQRFSYSDFPYPSLEDYDFFTGILAEHNPEDDILPYDVITPLFSDYAHKKRFLYVPEGQAANYNGDHEVLDMPEGTIFIKTFYYDNVQPNNETRIIETRLIYKYQNSWNFASYVWNESQENAFLDLNGSYTPIQFENDEGDLLTIDYRIPSETECKLCHKILNDEFPIGPKPQNLNKNYVYSDGEMNQLEKWITLGILSDDMPSSIETVADWTDESLPKLDRVRAYLDMNCSHCHRAESHCSYRDMRFAWNETAIEENLGVCMDIAEPIDPLQLYVVAPSSSAKSMMYYRMDNVEPSERMPLAGRTIIHEEGILLIKEWIDEMENSCD